MARALSPKIAFVISVFRTILPGRSLPGFHVFGGIYGLYVVVDEAGVYKLIVGIAGAVLDAALEGSHVAGATGRAAFTVGSTLPMQGVSMEPTAAEQDFRSSGRRNRSVVFWIW